MKKLRRLTYILWGTGAVSAVAAAVILVHPIKIEASDVSGALQDPLNETIQPLPSVERDESFDGYEQVFEKRDVFASLSKFSFDPSGDGGGIPGGMQQFIDLAEKYQVVGILVDQQPQAILQDKKTKDTVFLSVGDRVDGAVIDQIVEGKIILLLNGQAVELTP
jgi:hypothetical protein